MKKELSELSALNAEARERHCTYGQLIARTTPYERMEIIGKWRRYYSAPLTQGKGDEHGKDSIAVESDSGKVSELPRRVCP